MTRAVVYDVGFRREIDLTNIHRSFDNYISRPNNHSADRFNSH